MIIILHFSPGEPRHEQVFDEWAMICPGLQERRRMNQGSILQITFPLHLLISQSLFPPDLIPFPLFSHHSPSKPAIAQFCTLPLGDALSPRDLSHPPILPSNATFHQVKATNCFLMFKYPICLSGTAALLQSKLPNSCQPGPAAPKGGTEGRKVLSVILKAAPQWQVRLGMSHASRVTDCDK